MKFEMDHIFKSEENIPFRELYSAVIAQAIRDLDPVKTDFYSSQKQVEMQRSRDAVLEWFYTDDREAHTVGFIDCCEVLQLDPSNFRNMLFGSATTLPDDFKILEVNRSENRSRRFNVRARLSTFDRVAAAKVGDVLRVRSKHAAEGMRYKLKLRGLAARTRCVDSRCYEVKIVKRRSA